MAAGIVSAQFQFPMTAKSRVDLRCRNLKLVCECVGGIHFGVCCEFGFETSVFFALYSLVLTIISRILSRHRRASKYFPPALNVGPLCAAKLQNFRDMLRIG